VRRVSVAGISGSGKTTLARALAERLGVAYVELDALFHGTNWTHTPADEMRARVEAAIATASNGWIIDGNYRDGERLSDLVLGQADTLVWLELPLRLSMARLARRTWRRLRTREELWSGNREQLNNLVGVREGLFAWAVRSYFRHRHEVPLAVARNRHLHVVHLRTPREVERFLADAS
jgi:adenylate kinase family enzyme